MKSLFLWSTVEVSISEVTEPEPFGTAVQNAVLDSVDALTFLTSLTTLAASELSAGTREVLCGVTLLRPPKLATVASSSAQAQRMDELQYEHDDGPCLQAARSGELIVVSDFDTESRFGGYVDDIAGYGIRSALGVPAILDGGANAGLDFYSPMAGAFDDADVVAAAERLAREASMALRLAVRVADLTTRAAHLEAAMQNRTVIDLAAGIIMGQNRCSQERAVSILKMASSARNSKLSAVAAAVVKSVTDDPVDTHFT